MTSARLVVDPAELRDHFGDHRAAHIYALCDLEEPFWSASRWYRRGDAVVGLVGLGGSTTVYSVATKDPHGTLGLLSELVADLPTGTLITGPTGLAAMLAEGGYPISWSGLHHRYVLEDRPRALRALDGAEVNAIPLGRDDLDAIEALYDADPGAAFFLPEMIDTASWVGVLDGSQLVAAAGTHVLSESQGVGAIGAVYVRRSHRGRGLGRVVTAGVIARVAERIETIGLNVASSNMAAWTIYEDLGFQRIHDYEEAELA